MIYLVVDMRHAIAADGGSPWNAMEGAINGAHQEA